MKLYGLTDIGLIRKNNQDSYAIRVLSDDLAIAVVCDGMGGAQAGNVASAVAVEAFSAALEDACAQELPMDEKGRQELMREACKAANDQVYQLSLTSPEYRGMGTTLVGALILSDAIYVVNVGDSRCYIWSEHKLRQITSDHSIVQALVDRGDITPEEARTHPKKNLITRALGIDRDIRCDVFRAEQKTGDQLLLCSDGLTNVVTDERIESELSRQQSPEDTARTLFAFSVEQGAPDNVTVLLAQL